MKKSRNFYTVFRVLGMSLGYFVKIYILKTSICYFHITKLNNVYFRKLRKQKQKKKTQILPF